MSIKDLFNKSVPKIQKSVTTDELVDQVESSEFVEAKRKQHEQFIPPIDFTTASNFAKFGSAELYYEKAFERIHNYYPYDGTLHEKVEFENSSSYLDKHVFDNLYPRTNGYLNFNSSSYISVLGSIHTASVGMIGKKFNETFDLSMKYDEEKKRTSAFEFRGSDGITTEFWFKAPSLTGTKSVFHISGTLSDGEIYIDQNASSLKFLMKSGSSGLINQTFATITDNDWNHYAVTVVSSSAAIQIKGFKNGKISSQSTISGASYNIPHILPNGTYGLNARIGTDFTNVKKLTGSIDEFRFWKTARTPEEIFNNWFVPVGGGTNKHDSNIALSCYLKFNEGITGNSTLDSKVLDYSGRINNGTIQNFTTSLRQTGSAITEKLGQLEFKDPIVYSSHPDVISKKEEYKISGSLSDRENSSTFYSNFPAWMQEDDGQNGNQLKYLSQVLGSYFDTLWHQISYVPSLLDIRYLGDDEKPLPFAKKLLKNEGFVLPDLFVDSTITEELLKKDNNQVYSEDLSVVRNRIYHNIYNNLSKIYKSKGTEKSFRNFFRALGIGNEIVKLNVYADNSTFTLRDNYEYKSYERKYLDFNYEGHSGATIYQTTSSINNDIYLHGDSSFTGSFTFQAEVVLPRKQKSNENKYNPYPFLTSSIAGYHTGTSYTHQSLPDGLQIYVVHESLEGNLTPRDIQRAKFVLTGSNINLETDWYTSQYENNKWSLAFRMKHATYPRPNITGSANDDYLLEFYGVEADGNTERNSFLLTTSSVEHSYFSSNKIFYAGSHKTNFTGSTLQYTDVKLGYVRYWHSYLSNDAIKQHAFDSETFGANEPFEQDLVNVYPVEIPREKTLAFHWAFNNLTSSDSSGRLMVPDLSSGSSESNYGSLSNTIERSVEAYGIGFTNSSMKALDKMYVYSARKRLPDDLMSSDLTTIKTDETEHFFVDEDVSDNFYTFEKSMYAAVSDEMMNMFSTALDMNNIIGQPNQKYHHKYNLADFLRDRFFDDVENEPDIQKFTSFYKWIDDSISIAIQQLSPAGTRFSEKINNIVESHILERNKYIHQIPITTTFSSTEGSIKGYEEMNYNWKFGHAPTDLSNEANHVLWQKDRKEKDGIRETLRTSKNNHSIQSSGLIRREIGGSSYISDAYAVRKFAKTYDVSIVSQHTIHGGINFARKKNMLLFKQSIAPAGAIGLTSGAPQNIITIGVGTGTDINPLSRGIYNKDETPYKRKMQVGAKVGNLFGQEYGHDIIGETILPINIMSGTISTGFNSLVSGSYNPDVYLTNLHHDIIGNHNETPIQGPFTEQHVGGLQYRHIDLNQYDSNTGRVNAREDRAEGYGLVFKDHPSQADSDGSFGFIGADYNSSYPSPLKLKATRYRDETAKRPVNLRNIKTTTSSWKAGNYKNELEIFQVSPTFQKTWAIEAYNDPNWDIIPPFIATALPHTTHYQTLVGVAPFVSGNVFGVGKNGNRQPDTTSLTMVAPIPGVTAGISTFKVKGKDYIADGDSFRLTSLSSLKTFEVDTNGSYTGGTERIQTGSSDTDFYNNIKSSIESNLPGGFGVTYNAFAGSFSKGIEFNNHSAQGLSITSSLGTELDGLNFTFSAWVKTPATAGSVYYIYFERGSAGNGQGRELFITGTGQLEFHLNYVDNAPSNKQDEYRYANFRQNHSGSLTHIAIIKGNVALGDSTNAFLYINGVATSWTSTSVASAANPTTLNSPDFYHIGWNNSTNNFGHTDSPGQIDEVVLLNISSSAAQVAELYNGARQWNTGSLSAINYGSNVVAYYSFEEDLGDVLDGRTITDEKGFRNLVITDNDGTNRLTQETTTLAITIPTASFTITPNATGTYGNLIMAVNGSSFYSEVAGTGGIDAVAGVFRFSNDNVITIPRTDLTGSQRNIVTRFSAPGGPEVQSIGYLDAYTQTHAVHNAMPFRNLSVLGSGSGEEGTIRVEDHLGLRRGLRTLRGLHMGQFGIDSQYGEITSANYPSSGSFNKQHRNKSSRMEYSGSSIITGSNYDNAFINTPIPRSELQYSWIRNATSGAAGTTYGAPVQRIVGYAPRNGVVSSSAGYVEAIVFPTASSIFGS